MRLKTLRAIPIVALLSGCYYLQSTSIPIKTIEYKRQSASINNHQLMVLLPGIGDKASAFNKAGLIDEARKKNPTLDIVAVEAHFKYYEARTIIERLRSDIIKPAIDAGYNKIYLAGTSLGGFGSLLYLKTYPQDITKIFILAPYLGDAQDYDYLLNNAPAPSSPRDVNIWNWLTYLPEETKNKIYLAYGESDKFAVPNQLLSKQLPDNHTITLDGKHDWKTWAKLWPALMNKM